MRRDELIEQVEVESEDGRRFVLHIYETLEEFTPMGSDMRQWLATGLKRVSTDRGQACNRLDDGTFEIVALRLQVRRVTAPGATAVPRQSAIQTAAAARPERSSSGTASATAFISYSHEDKEFARALYEGLRRRGVQPWIDDEGLLVGDSLAEKIGEAIGDNDFVIALLSKASAASSWCQKELSIALTDGINRRRVKILPVRLDDARVPSFLADTKYVPADSRNPERLAEELALAMERHLGMMTSDVQQSLAAPHTEPRTRKPSNKKPWTIGRGPMELASSGRDATGYAWEIMREDERRRVVVWISGSAMASAIGSLPTEVADAIRSRGRSAVERVLAEGSPPTEVLAATYGIRLGGDS